jgi:alpha,alpha-trehalose phosphorylase
VAAEHGVDRDEIAAWSDAAAAMVIPYDDKLGVHAQSQGFTDHGPWDLEATRDRYPLMMHFPISTCIANRWSSRRISC